MLTSLIDLEGKVEGDYSFHIIRLVPTNRNHLDPNHAKGITMNVEKFDVNTLIL